ncbi:hypothetical protein HY338_03065, partial [Candidatus Gottesmanbacteria bacterium]|nr:hypothetical protein [Candidatus Gottesmanbacteria bacterium]
INLFNSEIVPSDPRLPGITFLNIKYIIVDNSADLLKNDKEYKLLNETASFRIYESSKFLPRFFFVPDMKIYNSKKDLEDNIYFDQNKFDRQISLLSTDVRGIKYKPDCSEKNKLSKIEVIKYDLNYVKLKSTSSCSGFISSSETNFPGWKATIDNIPAKILTSNLSFRSINIPTGTHIITMEYEPTIYFIGGIMSLITLGGLLIFCEKNQSVSE